MVSSKGGHVWDGKGCDINVISTGMEVHPCKCVGVWKVMCQCVGVWKVMSKCVRGREGDVSMCGGTEGDVQVCGGINISGEG